jgi:hypothetical protein
MPPSPAIAVDLTAVVVTLADDNPRVLVLRPPAAEVEALPSGPLEPRHRTLDAGLRAWVEQRTRASLGHVEQLYTFGDLDRVADDASTRVLSIGYLALVRGMPQATPPPKRGDTAWADWYRHLPWEDWRVGAPPLVGRIGRELQRWAADASHPAERAARGERVRATFGVADGWNEGRVLERYELLYEVGLVPEAHRGRHKRWADAADAIAEGAPMASDHRRILATAIARLRGRIKARPLVFELMPATFTLLQLQRAVEALAGQRLHKQNFRRLVAQHGLVEETGRMVTGTGGRPAREVRFRADTIGGSQAAPGSAPRRRHMPVT